MEQPHQRSEPWTFHMFLDRVRYTANWTTPNCQCRNVRRGELSAVTHCPIWHKHRNSDFHPSLSVKVSNHRLIFHCFSKVCEYEEIVDAFREREAWPWFPYDGYISELGEPANALTDEEEERRKLQYAWRVLAGGIPNAINSPLSKYLDRRGIGQYITKSRLLLYNPNLWHKNSQKCFPAMVAPIVNTGLIADVKNVNEWLIGTRIGPI